MWADLHCRPCHGPSSERGLASGTRPAAYRFQTTHICNGNALFLTGLCVQFFDWKTWRDSVAGHRDWSPRHVKKTRTRRSESRLHPYYHKSSASTSGQEKALCSAEDSHCVLPVRLELNPREVYVIDPKIQFPDSVAIERPCTSQIMIQTIE